MKNASKYKTISDRTDAFNRFCTGRKCSECPVHGSPHKGSFLLPDCVFTWLEMVTSDEIMPCPYCGNKSHVVKSNNGLWRVCCYSDLSCRYSSGAFKSEEEAVSNHNYLCSCIKNRK